MPHTPDTANGHAAPLPTSAPPPPVASPPPSAAAPQAVNGHDTPAPVPADRAVFEMLWKRATRGVAPFVGAGGKHGAGGRWRFDPTTDAGKNASRAQDLRDAILAGTCDVAALVRFVEELETACPEATEEARKIRMTKSMAAKQRRRS